MVRFPYRWHWSTVAKNLSHAWSDVCTGVRNLFRFASTVWWFRSWDYSGMLALMELSMRQMRDCQRDHGHHVGAEKIVRQLTIAAECCRRIREDNHFDNAGYDGDTWPNVAEHRKTQIAQHSARMMKQDIETLAAQLKHIQRWWD